MERMRPMSEAPPDEHWVHAWPTQENFCPKQVHWWICEGGGVWVDGDGNELDSENVSRFAGWTPIVRPLEPEALEPDQKPRCGVCADTHQMEIPYRLVPCTHCPLPCDKCRANGKTPYCATPWCPCGCHGKGKTAPEPEAQTMPPSMERAAFQLFSAAQESVALGQSLAKFQALAGVAHAQATKRAARVQNGKVQP